MHVHSVLKIKRSTSIVYRPIRKIVVILLSPQIYVNQSNHCRLIEYIKTNARILKAHSHSHSMSGDSICMSFS
jgi:hypothetical protein